MFVPNNSVKLEKLVLFPTRSFVKTLFTIFLFYVLLHYMDLVCQLLFDYQST